MIKADDVRSLSQKMSIFRHRIIQSIQNLMRACFYPLLCSVLCLLLVGYSQLQFHEILNLKGDNTQVLDFAKSYIDGFGFRYNPRQGYPGVLDNIYFPTFDLTAKLMMRFFGLFTSSAESSFYLLYAAGISLMASGGFFAFRSVKIRDWLSAIGACAFVVTPFFSSRVLGHDFLSLYYGVAFGGSIAMVIASDSEETSVSTFFRRPTAWMCIWFSATSGLYYAFFTCMFVCVAGIINASWRWRYVSLSTASITVFLIAALTIITGFGSGTVKVLHGDFPQVVRGSYEQISLGLNPAEAVASLAQVPGLSWTLNSYKEVFPQIMGVKGLYEWPSAILCLIIFSAPIVSAALPRHDRGGNSLYWNLIIQSASSFISFGFLYSIRGGIAYYFNILISSDIRGTDRIMPFLTFFSIVILLSIIEMAFNSKFRWVGVVVTVISIIALGYGLWPYIGSLAKKQNLLLSDSTNIISIESTRRMLLAKDAAGITTVLQLPHVAWPEQPSIRGFDPYSHENAYILDRAGSKTRWSYGSAIPQPAFKTVQALINDHLTSGFDQSTRDLGFDAILIEKTAYEPIELAKIQASISMDIRDGCELFNDKFRVLYDLNAGAKNCINKTAP